MRILILFLSLLVLAPTLGCEAAKKPGARMAGSFVDCMAPEVTPIAVEFLPSMKEAITGAIDNTGKFDRAKLRETASSLRSSAGQCVFTTAFNEIMNVIATAAGSPQSSPLEVDKADGRAAYEEIRGELFGGAKFKLADGTL